MFVLKQYLFLNEYMFHFLLVHILPVLDQLQKELHINQSMYVVRVEEAAVQ